LSKLFQHKEILAAMSASSFLLKPSMAWLVVFIPALSYYMGTRLHSLGLFRSSSYGEVIETRLQVFDTAASCDKLHTIFPLASCQDNTATATLKYPLYLVQQEMDQVVASCWQHDSELGRGFLLLSTAGHAGRIWRWETGGGPIAIGRTLCVHDSGCRSEHFLNCSSTDMAGSGGIAIDSSGKDHFQEGSLMVAEWGEGRIVRLQENGARTPLVIQVPDPCSNETAGATRRVHQPFSLLYTPFGDLLVLDQYDCGDALVVLKKATHMVPLDSLQTSRKAHSWTSLDKTTTLPEVVLSRSKLGGMALEPNWVKLYLTAKQGDSIVLLSVSLEEEDDEEETTLPNSQVVMDFTEYATVPGPIAVDKKGLIFLGVDKGVLIVQDSQVLARLNVPETPTALTLGEDNFLYISIVSSLLRIRVNEGPVHVPSNLVVKK
jgi:hypothetical protein